MATLGDGLEERQKESLPLPYPHHPSSFLLDMDQGCFAISQAASSSTL